MIGGGFPFLFYHLFLDQAGAAPEPASRVIVDPTFAWSAERPDGFRPGAPIAWIDRPGTRRRLAFHARAPFDALLPALVAGAPPPLLEPAQRATLLAAGILTGEAERAAEERRWDATIAEARRAFAATGWTILRGILHPLEQAALARYYRRVIDAGALVLGDAQSDRRFVEHNGAVARFLHAGLDDLMGRVAGEPVRRSYCYFACYQPGASLARHTDRPQCEHSISLLADFTGERPWPLHLEGGVAAELAPGDALFYRGRTLAHWRDPLPAGHSTSLFFHWVRPDFSGPLD